MAFDRTFLFARGRRRRRERTWNAIYDATWSVRLTGWGDDGKLSCRCGRMGTLPVGYDPYTPIGLLCSGCALDMLKDTPKAVLTFPGHEDADYAIA